MDAVNGRFEDGERIAQLTGRWAQRSWDSHSSDTNSSVYGAGRSKANGEKSLHEMHQEYQEKRNKPFRDDVKIDGMDAFLSQFVSQQRDISHQIHHVHEKLHLIQAKVQQVDEKAVQHAEVQTTLSTIDRSCVEWANSFAIRMIQACEKLLERLLRKRNVPKSLDASILLSENASMEAFSDCVSLCRVSSMNTEPLSAEMADAVENCEKSFVRVLHTMESAYKQQYAQFEHAVCSIQRKKAKQTQAEIEECKQKYKKRVEALKHQLRIVTISSLCGDHIPTLLLVGGRAVTNKASC